MKIEDVRLDSVVQIEDSFTGKGFFPGEKILIKGVVMQKGSYFALTEPISESGQVNCDKGINIRCIFPVKTELEKAEETIKKEIIE